MITFTDDIEDEPEFPPVWPEPNGRANKEALAQARVIAQLGHFHEARRHADQWAAVAGKRTYVVRNADRYFLADRQDLEIYHRKDIYLKRANVVYIGRPSL